jgi:TRAP-type C4-dicarboxylate transport system substrate-binding protein
MVRSLARILIAGLVMLPGLSAAEPIKLKLSFFTSDRTVAYVACIKPFVDAVNRDGKDLIEIEVHFSGTLGRIQKELPQLVLDGGADIAFIIPGQNPERFRDNTAIELPGLFRDAREATLVHTRLAAVGALAGYAEFVVIGAFGTQPETIHSRKPLPTLAALQGQRIRANNPTEAVALTRLGAQSAVLAFNETSPAISNGSIDGATAPAAQLFDVGIGRLVTNHYLLATSTAPLTLMMSRKAFDRLPQQAQALIRKYSGEWTAERFIEAYSKIDQDALAQLKADAWRSVVVPSPADLNSARTAFAAIRDSWAARSSGNRELLRLVDAELGRIRPTTSMGR